MTFLPGTRARPEERLPNLVRRRVRNRSHLLFFRFDDEAPETPARFLGFDRSKSKPCTPDIVVNLIHSTGPAGRPRGESFGRDRARGR